MKMLDFIISKGLFKEFILKKEEDHREYCRKIYIPNGKQISKEQAILRNKNIIDMRKEGLTYEKIGKKFGITNERVRQIIKEYSN